VRHVPYVLVQRPTVPERVQELAGAVTPERIMYRLEDCGSGLQHLSPGGVGVGDLDVQRGGRAAQRGRREA
jgi:hypothetical protein